MAVYYVFSGQMKMEIEDVDEDGNAIDFAGAAIRAVKLYSQENTQMQLESKVFISTQGLPPNEGAIKAVDTNVIFNYLCIQIHEIDQIMDFIFEQAAPFDSSEGILTETIHFKSTLRHAMQSAKEVYGYGDVYVKENKTKRYYGTINEDGIILFNDVERIFRN